MKTKEEILAKVTKVKVQTIKNNLLATVTVWDALNAMEKYKNTRIELLESIIEKKSLEIQRLEEAF